MKKLLSIIITALSISASALEIPQLKGYVNDEFHYKVSYIKLSDIAEKYIYHITSSGYSNEEVKDIISSVVIQ